MESMKFNVSVLSQEAKFDTFKRFGFQSGKDVDKFDGFDACVRAENGIYYITDGTNAYFSIDVQKTIDLGSHTMFIGVPAAMEVLTDIPSTSPHHFPEIPPGNGVHTHARLIQQQNFRCAQQSAGQTEFLLLCKSGRLHFISVSLPDLTYHDCRVVNIVANVAHLFSKIHRFNRAIHLPWWKWKTETYCVHGLAESMKEATM